MRKHSFTVWSYLSAVAPCCRPERDPKQLQIEQVDGLPLIRALRGSWFILENDGAIRHDLPVKNHPHSDIGRQFLLLHRPSCAVDAKA